VKLGPGLITGAPDDDPSGIATYSRVGARFGTASLIPVRIQVTHTNGHESTYQQSSRA
jgi:hypothetical protein